MEHIEQKSRCERLLNHPCSCQLPVVPEKGCRLESPACPQVSTAQSVQQESLVQLLQHGLRRRVHALATPAFHLNHVRDYSQTSVVKRINEARQYITNNQTSIHLWVLKDKVYVHVLFPFT